MFKKMVRKNKPQQRRKSDDSDSDDDEDQTSSSAHQQLEATKKRRQLLTQLQYKRGVDASDLLKPCPKTNGQSATVDTAVEEELPANTAAQQEGQIWEQKHQQQMEEYVKQQLQAKKQQDGTAEEPQDTQKKSAVLSQQDLYKELALKSAELSGKQQQTGDREATADTTAGNEALTAGAATAMAEVVLPVQDMTKAETTSKSSVGNSRGARNNMPSQTRTSANSAVPNRFRVYNTNSQMQQYPGQDQQQQQQQQQVEQSQQQQQQQQQSSVDEDRLGFAAARQQRPTHSSSSPLPPKKRSTDDRVYQKFVKRQREQQMR